MKRIENLFSSLILFFASLIFSVKAIAQDKSLDVDINVNKGGGNWYAQPWIWIVGAALFILLLVALLRGNNSRS